ncbi:phosphotransferase [Candidatus Woesearchaeota archaeon]|nr:phosphotransferase [Candidatus Woesearchaeota archaeon]
MKFTKERFKTFKNVFDNFTSRTLFKLASQGHFEEPIRPVSIGKESNVFSAKKGRNRVIIKIYRLEACDFNGMYNYIKYDPRFLHLKPSRRKVIFAWVQREFRNLMKAREGGVRVPTPITFLNNILVEEYIGDKYPAPKLKDSTPENLHNFWQEILENLKKLHKAGLVHADMSHFNILNHNEKPVLIDFSQCTPLSNPNSHEYLERDVRNICNYMKRLGLKLDKEEVLQDITVP